MKEFIVGLILFIFLSCHNSSQDNNLSKDNNSMNNFDGNIQKANISLQLVDSIEKSAPEYNFYENISRFPFSPPFYADGILYIVNNYHDIKISKIKTIAGGNDVCYSYQNGKCDKFLITHDESKIYGYNLSKGGMLQFTINNPFGLFDGFTKILYADTSVIFLLDNDIDRHIRGMNNSSPANETIYKYDIAKKRNNEFFKTIAITPSSGFHDYIKFYITRISGNRFLFAMNTPWRDIENAVSLSANVSLVQLDDKNYTDGVIMIFKSNRWLYQLSEIKDHCVFRFRGMYKVPASSTTKNYSSLEEVEYLSLGVENLDIHIRKNPYFFTEETGKTLNVIGNLYFLNSDNIYFVSKDLENFYPIPSKNNKTFVSHVIYIPSKNKYCYVEVDNNKNGKIYIYEINNLDKIH